MKPFVTTCLALVLGLGLLLAPLRAAAQALHGTFATGADFSLSIHADGTLWATGDNNYGQLGTGTTATAPAWVQVGTASTWVQVATGGYHGLGLQADGSLWAWGSNLYGQLGIATNSGTSTPNPVPTRVGQATSRYTQVAAGSNHTLALTADGNLYAWGANLYGQLGITLNSGTLAANPTPIWVGTYAQMAASEAHNLALKADGSLYAWGYNLYGQLGVAASSGTSTLVLVPTRVGQATDRYTQVAANVFHSLALKADGSLWAWGANASGQLGSATNLGTYAPNPTPVRVGTDTYTQVAAGSNHTLALRADGRLYAWGDNWRGQLGNPASGNGTTFTPSPVGTATDWVQVAANYTHSLGLRADGTLFTWGQGYYSRSIGGTAPPAILTPTATGTALPTRSTAMGANFGLAVRADGTLWAWGDNTYGQLGDGTTTARPKPRQVGTDRDWVLVAAGLFHSLALKADGTLWAWGYNGGNQLGTPATSGSSGANPTPTQVAGLYTQVAAGDYHSLGLRADGTLWAWGINQDGQLGNSTPASAPAPVRVGTALYTQVAVGAYHSLGVRPDGTLWAWGANGSGQLGSPASNGIDTPTRVGASTDLYTRAVAGGFFSLGLRADGALYAWGQNSYGQLGTTVNSGTFVAVPTPTRVGTAAYTQVAAGRFHTLALRAEGTLWAWGQNYYGQLGSGAFSAASVPIPTPTQEATAGTTWTTLALGATGNLSLVRTPSGLSFASAGRNDAGQLGDGTTTDWPRFDRLSPLSSLQSLPVLAAVSPAKGLRIYPNPAEGRATTLLGTAPGTAVQVLDALGRPVLATAADATGAALLTLPAALPAGIYLVRSGGQTLRLAVP